MRLIGNGTERHGPGGESLDDVLGRLDLFKGHRGPIEVEIQQAAQGQQALVLFIDRLGVVDIGLPVIGAGRMLELGDGFRRPDVILAAHAVGVFAADIQRMAIYGRVAIGRAMAFDGFLGDFRQTRAVGGGAGAGEEPRQELVAESHGIEDLGAAIGLIGRDAHLGHDLQQALADRLDVALVYLVLAHGFRQFMTKPGQRVEGQVGVDGLGAIASQQGEMMNFAGFAGLDDQTDLGPEPAADQVVMHGGGGQQRRNGDVLGIHVPIGNDEDVVAVMDRLFRPHAERLDGTFHAGGAGIGGIGKTQGGGLEGAAGSGLDAANLFQILVAEDGLMRLEPLVGAAVLQIEQIGARADVGHQGHDQFLADRVDGRVGHLGEALLEIVVQHARAAGQYRQGRVGAHGANRFLAAQRHRRQEEFHVLLGIAEGLLTVHQRLAVRRHGRNLRRQVLQLDLGFVQPLLVR